jgi:LemA protein
MDILPPLLFIVAAIALLIGSYFLYVEIIKRKNKAEEAWSDIDVQLKKRYDLIPNLVTVAKKYMEFEKDIFTKITELRSQVNVTGKVITFERIQAETKLGGALNQLMIKAENYPDLKADQEMLQLQKTLVEIEEHIAASRRFYNSAVADCNNVIKIFPGNIIADVAGVKPFEFFSGGEEIKNVPGVNPK